MKSSPLVATLAALLGAVVSNPIAVGAQESAFPLRGEVASKTHSGLAVRKEPPEATAFTYKLGERTCGVANGSTFTAFDRHLVANGEVWYQVEITEVTRSLGGSPCPAPPFSGWMIAQTKRGSVVEVLERNVDAAQTRAEDVPQAVEGGSTEPESDPSVLDFLTKYLFLVLGTGVGVAVISMERKRRVWPPTWLTAIVWLELVVLSAANVLFVVLLVDSEYTPSDTDALADGGAGPLFALVTLFEAVPGGFLVLGFILAAIWMKFMSFASEQ